MKKISEINIQTIKKAINVMWKKLIKIFVGIKNIILSSMIILSKEIFMAILPVFLIFFICILNNRPYPYSTIYNNLFIGFTTLNAGNMIYLNSDCGIHDKTFIQVLFLFSLISMLCSLAGAAVICLNEMNEEDTYNNVVYCKVYLGLSISVFFVEVLKIYEKCKERKGQEQAV